MQIAYGICCNTYGALFDLRSKSMLLNDNGEWTINIFKALADMNLAINFGLAGPAVDAYVAAGTEAYRREMTDRKITNLYY